MSSSLSSSLTSIEDKKYEKKNGTTQSKDNNWRDFTFFVLYGFIITLGVGVFGSNFIFLSTTDNLEYFLPTNESSYFKPEQLGGGYACMRKPSGFKGVKLGNWPYSMRKSGYFHGIFQSFKNWIANTTADTFITNRGFIKSWINLFSPNEDNTNPFSNNFLQMFLIAPLTYSFAPFVFLISLFTAFISAFKAEPLWGLAGFFLLFIWPITTSISFIQLLQYIALFSVIPAFTHLEDIKGILNCNAHMLSLFFGGFVCLGALLNLKVSISATSIIIYGIMVLISILKK